MSGPPERPLTLKWSPLENLVPVGWAGFSRATLTKGGPQGTCQRN